MLPCHASKQSIHHRMQRWYIHQSVVAAEPPPPLLFNLRTLAAPSTYATKLRHHHHQHHHHQCMHVQGIVSSLTKQAGRQAGCSESVHALCHSNAGKHTLTNVVYQRPRRLVDDRPQLPAEARKRVSVSYQSVKFVRDRTYIHTYIHTLHVQSVSLLLHVFERAIRRRTGTAQRSWHCARVQNVRGARRRTGQLAPCRASRSTCHRPAKHNRTYIIIRCVTMTMTLYLFMYAMRARYMHACIPVQYTPRGDTVRIVLCVNMDWSIMNGSCS